MTGRVPATTSGRRRTAAILAGAVLAIGALGGVTGATLGEIATAGAEFDGYHHADLRHGPDRAFEDRELPGRAVP